MYHGQHLYALWVASLALAVIAAGDVPPSCGADAVGEDHVELLQEFNSVTRRIRHHAETSQKILHKGTPVNPPTVLITGTGDSGTRGVARAYQELGMYFCNSCKNEVEDNMPSLTIGLERQRGLLISGNGTISKETHRAYFSDTVEAVKTTIVNTNDKMLVENPNLNFDDLIWGIKVPAHFYLQPVYDYAFNRTVRYLMVARDPRDTCTGENQRNLHSFGPYLRDTDHGHDCWGFYASFWTSLFDAYEFDPHFKVLRVEDLVVPEPTENSFVLNCMADFAGLPQPSAKASLDILSEAHKFNSSYMGHHYNMTDAEREDIENDLANRVATDKKLQIVMSKLGYGFDHYELKEPKSPSVCKQISEGGASHATSLPIKAESALPSLPPLRTIATEKTDANTAPKPHIVFMLADDLGWYDQAITGDQSEYDKYVTSNLTNLAWDGMRLNYHYVHWHCSPTRRAFLTGRSPLHHGEDLSKPGADHIDLRWTWISEKLTQAGYVSHYYGKGHTGYQSMAHMPARRGFNGGQVMFLGGSGSYYTLEHWNGTSLLGNASTNPNNYSTDLFGELSVKAIEDHDPSIPMFLFIAWQAVHGPMDYPTWCKQSKGTQPCGRRVHECMHSMDIWTGTIIDALKKKGMYSNTLIVFTSDNGGLDNPSQDVDGRNYPLRGQKGSNFQGGIRAVSFINGGFIPDHIRGTVHNGTFHITDWYPTFCRLAGVDASDDPPVAALHADLSNPSKDLYGTDSYPSIDGIDIWDALISHASPKRQYLWVSGQVLIKDGRYKLLTAQGLPETHKSPPSTGWREANGSWTRQYELDSAECGVAYKHREHLRPCLFDLLDDEREERDLSGSMPELVSEMWAELNRTNLHAFTSRSPASLKGPCNETCTKAHWKNVWGEEIMGPMCGVEACS